ncbi:hypothetical protein HELRODRAFT_166002 [Helobdella robusta]|uniref:Endonuclease/exonuclease/phosphatase domain-containing protein n=1 Tax=Helobdella robusta TaxID=6412 RepID=T1EXK4_HELRO|nr:hypothetical protein HELRODRAFT_166002 [Helobdella robusta]ESN90344.1 hypothetical protein HELRODRAFT_166002 [Helobdella robusta]
MDLHGLCKLINLPTRITANKQSVIDNIFVDGSLNVCLQGVLACDLSDHLPVLTQISFSKQVKKEKLIVAPSTKFLFSSNRISNLNKRLCEIDWTDVYDCWDVEMAWVKFVELFKCCMIKCCQVSNNKINKISKQKPWFNSENKKILKAKNRLFKKSLKNPNDENNNNYKSANKIYTKIKNNAKKQYFHNILENNKHDMKKSWKIMNDVLRRSNNDSKSNNIHLKRNGQIVNDPENALNDHFVSIAEKLNKFKGVGVHRAENLDTYWQEFHRGKGVPIFFHFLVRCPGCGQTAFFTCQVYISFGKGARDRNIPRQTSTALQVGYFQAHRHAGTAATSGSCNKHEMSLVAKNSSLLSPDLTLILLPISLRNLRVLGSIGPRTSMHIGKNSIEGRAFPYFFIFSSAALAAAKPHSLLINYQDPWAPSTESNSFYQDAL